MGGRRFLPLIAIALALTAALLARLFSVQLGEADVWTAEAARLVRQGSVVPYLRGEILDRRGRVLARDVQSYQIEVVYRDFRRNHVLGIVAHAWSAIELRPVPLAEALRNLEPLARALVQLSPADLERFADGEGLSCGSFVVAPALADEREHCASRAADLRFYVPELLGFDKLERRRLRALESSDALAKPYIELLASWRRAESTDVLARELDRALAESAAYLGDLAALWKPAAPPAEALAALVQELEGWRRQVEDEAAGDLFSAATGFSAGRLEPELCERAFDLEWISKGLRWDAARTHEWVLASRARWLELRDQTALEAAMVEMQFAPRKGREADRVLDQLAALFAAPRSASDSNALQAGARGWRELGEPEVLRQLGSLFELDVPRAWSHGPPVLPFQSGELAALTPDRADDGELLARAELWQPAATDADDATLRAASAEWRTLLGGAWRDEGMRLRCRAFVHRCEMLLQAELARRLDALLALAKEQEALSPSGKLPLSRARLDRAEERTSYILKDRGSRSFVAVRQPDYALVNLLTRYPEHLRGFQVAVARRRMSVTADESGRPLAEALIGGVRKPELYDLRRQRELVAELERLKRLGQRDELEGAHLAELVREVDRPDELRGASGLEAWFDRELSGKNGFSEFRGLRERLEKGARVAKLSVERVDGAALWTTLDLDLQRAAVECLAHPEGDPAIESRDAEWLEHPTGAIVLATPDGEVLAAASFPTSRRGDDDAPRRVADEPHERTLRRPDFQPPGSVFKPFVAAYALARLALDPHQTVDCSAAANPGGHGPGYRGLHCHETTYGHGLVDLRAALKGSCNSYFAWLGERFTTQDYRALAAEFGFGERTGVRALDETGRRGFAEDPGRVIALERELTQQELRLAANGLAVIETTPMQMARATAAIATGRLPRMTLVRRIGERVLEPESRELALAPRNLALVRDAMLAVTNETGGTAHTALNPRELGFELAAKTGSADLTVKAVDEERVLKHTWVAAWFPAERPAAVVVVFLYQTRRTSSHSAVWLARQFLKRPEVREWLDREGNDP